jgi:sporulation protein YlmC with PRC-barrel domain
MIVENRDGEKLGKIDSVIVDIQSGEIKYGVISSGGLFGLDAHLKAVPAASLSMATAKKRTLALLLDRGRWAAAPAFGKSDLETAARPGWESKMHQFYGPTLETPMPSPQGSPKNDPTASLKPTGNANARSLAAAGGKGQTLRLASDLVGKAVVGRPRENIGQVSDLLLDFGGQNPAFAIVSAMRFARRDEGLVVPISCLIPAPNGDLIFVANPARLEQAQPFDEKAWESARLSRSDAVYRYEGHDADNTGRNTRDRERGSLTPMAQSETKADRQLTRQIRRALMKDPALSWTAKNIKIITVNGKVTLRGPVHGEQERNEIARQAEHFAGPANVNNDLEVE